MLVSQELSEHDIYLDECEHNEPHLTLLDDNSNDENDVDDETMSGITQTLIILLNRIYHVEN